mgnify:CR=1 FL=1
MLASVRRNLRDVLNTRVGSAAAQMDMGTLPPNEILQGIPEALDRIQRAIAACIERYEPRLRDVAVILLESLDDPLAIHFIIRGRLRDDSEVPISFETAVDAHGRFDLRGR